MCLPQVKIIANGKGKVSGMTSHHCERALQDVQEKEDKLLVLCFVIESLSLDTTLCIMHHLIPSLFMKICLQSHKT